MGGPPEGSLSPGVGHTTVMLGGLPGVTWVLTTPFSHGV